MALKIWHTLRPFGHVHLTFDREIEAEALQLSFYNRISREYLALSQTKPSWRPALPHFFNAKLVERKNSHTTFEIGPEVTSFLWDECPFEVTSDDGAIREVVVWIGPPSVQMR
jgi:hypothetical protein